MASVSGEESSFEIYDFGISGLRLSGQDTPMVKSPACDICKLNALNPNVAATWWCEGCRKNFCDDCKAKHYRKEVCSKDQIHEIALVKCGIHTDEVIKAFCFECNRCVCATCMLSGCEHHHQEKLSHPRSLQACGLLRWINTTKKEAFVKIKESHKQNIQEQKEAIDKMVEKVIKQATEEAEQLKQNMDAQSNTYCEQIDELISTQDSI